MLLKISFQRFLHEITFQTTLLTFHQKISSKQHLNMHQGRYENLLISLPSYKNYTKDFTPFRFERYDVKCKHTITEEYSL